MKELTFLIILSILYMYARRNRPVVEQEVVEPFQEQIEMALALARAEEAITNRASKPAPAANRVMLEEKGIKFTRKLSEIEAEHLLGLFQPPSARQMDILKHFKIARTSDMSKTQANYYIRSIFMDTANIEEWNQRPATTRVKQGVLFLSGQLINNMTQVEAQSLLIKHGMENPLKYSEWKHIEKLFIAVNDAEILKRYCARKITWRRFFHLYETIKAKGIQFNDISVDSILKQAAMENEPDRRRDQLLSDDMIASTS